VLTPWKVLSSRLTYGDRWLRVRSDACRTAAGDLIDPYHVLEYPAWVNVVALTAEGEIVLVRQYRHGARTVMTELPSGNVEAGESPEAAARRELEEETGLSAGTMVPVGTAYANPASHDNRVHSFLALELAEAGGRRHDPGEEIEVVRRDFAGYLGDVLAGREPAQALHLAALHFAVHHLRRDPALAELRARLDEVFDGGTA
jgi:8-oxo-dGTP pyrophosphatase MutT (NUDIX family)